MDPEPEVPVAPIPAVEEKATHPMLNILTITRTIEVVSNLALLGMLGIVVVNHMLIWYPWYIRKLRQIWNHISALFHATIDVFLADEEQDFPMSDELSMNELYPENYTTARLNLTNPAEKEDWEVIPKNPAESEESDSEYDTSSEDRLSFSSDSDDEDVETKFFTPSETLSRRRRHNPIVAKMLGRTEKCCCCCNCNCHNNCHNNHNNKRIKKEYTADPAVTKWLKSYEKAHRKK